MLIRLLRTYLRRYRGILVARRRPAVRADDRHAATCRASTPTSSTRASLTGDTAYIWRIGALMLARHRWSRSCFAIGAVYFGSQAAMGFGRDVRSGLFHQVTDFSAREVGQFGAPSLITRITNDVQQVQMLVLMTCTLLVAAPDHDRRRHRSWRSARTSGCRAILARQHPGAGHLRRHRRRRGWCRSSGSMQERIDGVNRVLREQITGIRVVRAFVREPDEAERFDDANDDLTDTSLQGRPAAWRSCSRP